MATNALKWYSTTDGNKKVAINLATTAAEPSENLYVNGSANITGIIRAAGVNIPSISLNSADISNANISNADIATMTADSATVDTLGVTTFNAAEASISDAVISSASISNLTFKTKTVSIDTSNWITIDGSDNTKINIVIPKVLVVPTS